MQQKVMESAHHFFVWFQSSFFVFVFCFVEDFINPVAQLPNSRMATQRRQSESVSVKESVLSYVL